MVRDGGGVLIGGEGGVQVDGVGWEDSRFCFLGDSGDFFLVYKEEEE